MLVDDRDVEVAVAVVVGHRAAAAGAGIVAGLFGHVGEGAVAIVRVQQLVVEVDHGGDVDVLPAVVVGVQEVDPPGVGACHARAGRLVVRPRPGRVGQVQHVAARRALQRGGAQQVGDVEVPGAVEVDVRGGDAHAGLRVVADPRPIVEHRHEAALPVAVDLVAVQRPVGAVARHVHHVQVGPQVVVEVRAVHHQRGPIVGGQWQRAVAGIGKGAVALVVKQAIAVGRVRLVVDHDVADVQVDAAVAVVVEPVGRLGAVRRQLPERGRRQVVHSRRRGHLLEQRPGGGQAAAVLGKQVLEQQVGRSVGRVVPLQTPFRVIGVHVDVLVAVVVVVGEHRARHLHAGQLGQQVVPRREAAVAAVQKQARRESAVAAHREQVGPAVAVHVDPVYAQAVGRQRVVDVAGDPGGVADVAERQRHGVGRAGVDRPRRGLLHGGRRRRHQRRPQRRQGRELRAHRQHQQAAQRCNGPGAGGKGRDAASANHPRQAPERDRPAGCGREQQGRARRRAGAQHQQQRDQRNLEQQRHVDQHAQGGRGQHPQQAVAQVGVDRLRLQELDRRTAGKAGHHHQRRHLHHQAAGGPRPLSRAGYGDRGPGVCRIAEGSRRRPGWAESRTAGDGLTISPWRNNGCMRAAMHPVWRRCPSLTYARHARFVAPCQSGASPLSVGRRVPPRAARPGCGAGGGGFGVPNRGGRLLGPLLLRPPPGQLARRVLGRGCPGSRLSGRPPRHP